MTKNVSVRLPDDVVDELDEEADEKGVSRAEHIRDCLEARNEPDGLETELERARAERDRMERKLEAALERQDEHTELVEYVEKEKSIVERREERKSAPAWRRAKWWLFGTDH